MEKNNNIQIVKKENQELSLPNTLKEFSITYNPRTCLRLFKNVTSIEKSLTEKSVTLGKLSKQYGEEKIENYLKVWLINLNESLNLKRPLTETQIDETAFIIVNQHKNLSITDINLIFQWAKSGKFGAFYESLSIDKILTWFREYFEQRCEVAGALTRQKADKLKYQEQKIGSNRANGLQELRDLSMRKKHKQ